VSKTLVLAAIAAAIFASTALADQPKDPRVCDGHPAAYCAQQAASIVAWKAEMHAIGAPTPWSPQCVPAKPSLLQYRCFLQHGMTSGAAGLVRYDPVSFKSSVTFGPAAIAFIADAKSRVAAARAANG
jgi:hypothetical protein